MNKLLILLLSLLALPLAAQEDELKELPGYVHFGELSAIFGEPSVQVAIGQSMIALVGSMLESEDPATAALFKRLRGVRVNVFETEGLVAGATDYVQDVSARLAGSGWESVVSVNAQDEQVRVFMKMRNGTIEGLTLMAVEANEAAFVNIIGSLNPAELGKVMDNFDLDIDVGGNE